MTRHEQPELGFDGPAGVFHIDCHGRDSQLTVEGIDRDTRAIILRSQVDGEPDELKVFTREAGRAAWRWPNEGGWRALVAHEVAAWLEEHWQLAVSP